MLRLLFLGLWAGASASCAVKPWHASVHRAGTSNAPEVVGTHDDYPYLPVLDTGRYRNPVIYADYSDPDLVRVGGDYYLVSSSFNCTPALPILRSRDLVNWTIVTHALDNLPGDRFGRPQLGQGVWAPSIRAHGGTFYVTFPIYCRPPDDGPCAEEGIWVVTATDMAGPWSKPHHLLAARGVIDPALFWDDDDRVYLVHAYARSRAGVNARLDVVPISPDVREPLGPGRTVFSDPLRHPTLEGPKLYKRNGWYLILAPAGGVATGWQVALRARSIFGPYEDRVVLEKGGTSINGPHQGGLVDTPDGNQWWFVHFQDAGGYGRIVHLNPVTWEDDWPLMGGAGRGGLREPVRVFTRPNLPPAPIEIPQTTDEFSKPALGPQWQWQANHEDAWLSLSARPGYLRLYPPDATRAPGSGEPGGAVELATAPNLLLQKLPARSFRVETSLELAGMQGGTRAGLVLWGDPLTALTIEEHGNALRVSLISAGRLLAADTVARTSTLRLGVTFSQAEIATFSYQAPDAPPRSFTPGIAMTAKKGGWIGVKVGLFAVARSGVGAAGYVDVDYFRFAPLAPPRDSLARTLR
jgi:beta-xylosidase